MTWNKIRLAAAQELTIGLDVEPRRWRFSTLSKKTGKTYLTRIGYAGMVVR